MTTREWKLHVTLFLWCFRPEQIAPYIRAELGAIAAELGSGVEIRVLDRGNRRYDVQTRDPQGAE